jgi:hypothetical protein
MRVRAEILRKGVTVLGRFKIHFLKVTCPFYARGASLLNCPAVAPSGIDLARKPAVEAPEMLLASSQHLIGLRVRPKKDAEEGHYWATIGLRSEI